MENTGLQLLLEERGRGYAKRARAAPG